MIRAHTVEQVRAAEAELMARLPEGALMQRAAAGLAYAVIDFLGGAYGRRVLLLVGSGDNGGDALYAGVTLARRGARVDAWLLSEHAHPAGVAALRAAGGRVSSYLTNSPSPGRDRGEFVRYDVVVDGIVGIGGRPGLRPDAVAALAAVAGVPVVAVDTPSGVDVDTGELAGPCVTADLTVTFGTHKPCHLLDPAALHAGAVQLVDIGLVMDRRRSAEPVSGADPSGLNETGRHSWGVQTSRVGDFEALQPADVAALLPRPAPDAHKYTRGVVGVRAGSAAYPGAAVLSVAGASCGLAGMVRYAGDRPVLDAIRAAHPEVVGPGRVQAWVVGSGSDDTAEQALRAALADDVPVVVDADALAHAGLVTGRDAVLTPHAGELARLLDVPRDDVDRRPLQHLRTAVDRFGCTVLLKGRHTLVAGPGTAVRATLTGTPWLATAGAGDVLGGLIGALLATGLTAYDAASVGSWLHGAAATSAARRGPIVAGDVARELPLVVGDLLHRPAN